LWGGGWGGGGGEDRIREGTRVPAIALQKVGQKSIIVPVRNHLANVPQSDICGLLLKGIPKASVGSRKDGQGRSGKPSRGTPGPFLESEVIKVINNN